MLRKTLQVLLGPVLAVALASCFTTPGPSERRHGPPSHAPAHGYRAQHSGGAEMVYDAGLRAYVLVGKAHNTYFVKDLFYRWHDGRWELSLRSKGPWKAAREDAVPPRIRGKHKSKYKDGKREAAGRPHGKPSSKPGKGKGRDKKKK